jgi:DNA-binding CsgD family transcriptional regulator
MSMGVFAVTTTADELSLPGGPGELAALSTVAVETLNFALWSLVEERYTHFGPAAGAFSELEFRIHWGRSALYEANGQPEEALDSARAVSRSAASVAANLLGRCRRAAVLLRYGERLAYQDLASSIRRQFESLDSSTSHDWATALLPFEVAETLAPMGDPTGAENALRSQYSLVEPPLPDSENQARLAIRACAEGVVADAAGAALKAQRCYRRAFEMYRHIGFTRRAMNVALRLAEMTGDEAFAMFVDDHAHGLSPRSWIRAKLSATAAQRRDPVLQRLSRSEREVLAYLVDGRSTAEIAAARNRSPQTTRNTISKLFSVFGVGSRSALLRDVGRRRLLDADGAPTWGNTARPV